MRPITTKSKIKRHFSCLPPGQMVATSELVIHGKRTNVDKAVQLLIRSGFIIRLARGVFIRPASFMPLPTIEQIAAFKAKSFGRDIRVEKKIGAPLRFSVDGASSTFQSIHGRVHYHHASKKELFWDDSPAGLNVRRMLEIGQTEIRPADIEKASSLWFLNRTEKDKLLHSKQWMPGWLGDLIQTKDYIGPQPPKRPILPPTVNTIKKERDQTGKPVDLSPDDHIT